MGRWIIATVMVSALGLQAAPAHAEEAYERPLYCGAVFDQLSERGSLPSVLRWAKDFNDEAVRLMVEAQLDEAQRQQIMAEMTERVIKDMAIKHGAYSIDDCAATMKQIRPLQR
jgi:hypothetical protein